jgi:histidinol-phosphate aminotransferase
MSWVPAIRDDLVSLEPYVAHQVPARYRLNTNESPYPPSQSVLDAIAAGFADLALHRYPERDAPSLRAALGDYTGRRPDEIWVANGSNEVLQHLFLAFAGPGRKVLTFEPTYSLHSLIARIAGSHVVQDLRGDNLQIDADRAVSAVRQEQPDVVMLCSPNNPSGGCDPIGLVQALLAEVRGLVIVDEAYGEFAEPEESVAPLLDDHPNLVVVKTLSKAWRLAGARIGYMLANPAVTTEMLRVRLPYHLSSITQLIGGVALAHTNEALEKIGAIVGERDRLAIELQALGLKTYPSRANFVLFEVDDAGAVWQALLDREVLIRNYSTQPLLDNCLRVTAGLPDENEAFVAAIREVMSRG